MRISIDTSFFVSHSFFDFCLEMQSKKLAIGAYVEAWILASQYVSQENTSGLVPLEEWKARGIDERLVKANLARIIDDKVQLLDASRSFLNIVQRKNASIQGGKVRSKQANATRPDADRMPTATRSGAARVPRAKRSADTDESMLMRQETWESYKLAYEERWRVLPDRNATLNSNIKALVEKVGQDAPNLVRFYLSHNDGLYVKACHPMSLCLRDHVALKTQMLRGQAITTADIRRLERQQEHQSIIDDAKRGGF